MLKRARASPGMRLTVGLPTSTEVNSRFDGSKCSLPSSSGRLQRGDQRRQAADRVVGAIGIGDVALAAGDDQRAVERAAPADLDGVAEHLDVARLAEDAVVECLAALRRPSQQLDGAVDRDAFLVAGDQERDRALVRLAAVGGEMVERRRRRSRRCRPSCRRRRGRKALSPATSPANGGCCQAASSPGGTTSVCPANTRLGFRSPIRANRFSTGAVPGSAKVMRWTVNPAVASTRLQIGERPALLRRHRAAADEIAGNGDGIGGHQSRLRPWRSGSVEPVPLRSGCCTGLNRRSKKASTLRTQITARSRERHHERVSR